MPTAADLIPILHRVALWAFVGVTAVSLLVAVKRRVRLRRPLLAWHRPGSLFSLPPGPLLFLLLVAVGFGHAWLSGRSLPPAVLVGYPAGGFFWFVAAWLFQTAVVTEHGIVPDLSHLHRAVAWGQIVDYVVTTRDGRPHFVFFYRVDGEHRRLDLSVPRPHAAALRQIVERTLGDRFSVPDEEAWDDETLGRLDDRIDLS